MRPDDEAATTKEPASATATIHWSKPAPPATEIAEASEALGRARAADGRNGVVKLIRHDALAPEVALGADRLAAALGAMDAPEFQRCARGGERELAENGARQKFKRCFKLDAGTIRPRHQRDADGVLAVGEDRGGQLVFPVYFFGRQRLRRSRAGSTPHFQSTLPARV